MSLCSGTEMSMMRRAIAASSAIAEVLAGGLSIRRAALSPAAPTNPAKLSISGACVDAKRCVCARYRKTECEPEAGVTSVQLECDASAPAAGLQRLRRDQLAGLVVDDVDAE